MFSLRQVVVGKLRLGPSLGPNRREPSQLRTPYNLNDKGLLAHWGHLLLHIVALAQRSAALQPLFTQFTNLTT